MKKQPLTFRFIIAFLLVCILCFIGCYQFDFVNQPFTTEPGSSFKVEISVTMYPGTGTGYAIPYFGILLPIGWTVDDSIVFYYDNSFGMLVYSDSLTQLMYDIEPAPLFYHWWVAEGLYEVYHSVNLTYHLSPVVHTDDQTGMFYLDYMIGDDGNGLNYRRSNDHLITVGLPQSVTVCNSNDNGPGSLRNAIDAVDFYGTINFDLDPGDTIILEDQLSIYKDLQMTAQEENPVVISGNNQYRIFNITEGRSPVLSNLHIVSGKADLGAGICCIGSSVYLKNITFKNNSAEKGGGIYGTSIYFDSAQRSNVYHNNAIWGNDIYSETTVELFLDTFTVMYPTEYHLFPRENFTCDILNGKLEQVDADLFVSPEGNNSNTGLTSDDPLQTIDFAFKILLADSLNQHVIHLLNGTYSPSSNTEKFPVNLPDFIGLSGESESGVILDAEEQSDALLIDNNAATSCASLTIKRGDMGIYSTNSNLMLSNATVTCNNNHGIYCIGGLLDLENVKITNNTANGYQGYGGGIQCMEATAIFRNTNISYNTCNYSGGGIYFEYVTSLFENVTISHNTAVYGGGISCHFSTFDFDSTSRCNIYLNIADYGNDINLHSYANVVLDTFTVLYPTEFHALGDLDFDVLHGKIEQADCDLYVSPEGDDNNSGLSPEDPLKTIYTAQAKIRADAAHHHIIQLLEGTYGPASNGEKMPVLVPSYYSINGISAEDVILDAAGLSGVMEVVSEAGTKISNLTITGGNAEYGGGISCKGNLTLQNTIIMGNLANHGAGIDFGGWGVSSADAVLQNVLICDNTAADRGGGIYCSRASVSLQNVTMTNNEGARGGGLYCQDGSGVTIKNSILSGNTGEVYFLSFNSENYVYSYWSDINGWIETFGNGAFIWIEGNLSENPLFSGAGDHPYALSQDSPCIDTGLNTVSNMPEWDILGNTRIWDGDGNGSAIVDMGAYEFGSLPVGMSENEFQVPSASWWTGLQLEVWPNPASDEVTVAVGSWQLAVGQNVKLTLVDLFGREVRMLMAEVKSHGEHTVRLDVSNLVPGIYLVRVQAGGQSEVRKLVVR